MSEEEGGLVIGEAGDSVTEGLAEAGLVVDAICVGSEGEFADDDGVFRLGCREITREAADCVKVFLIGLAGGISKSIVNIWTWDQSLILVYGKITHGCQSRNWSSSDPCSAVQRSIPS